MKTKREDALEAAIECVLDGTHDVDWLRAWHTAYSPEQDETQIELDRFLQMLLDEYEYWRDVDEQQEDLALIAMGAMGAVSNVIGRLYGMKPHKREHENKEQKR